MSSTPHVEFSLRAGTGEIRLNRPEELNALTLEMIEAIDAQLAAWAGDPKVTGVLIGESNAGDAFCAGIDQRALYNALQSGDREYGTVLYRRFYQLLYRIATYPKVTVAVMDGITMGGGVSLGQHCRIRVGTRNCYLAFADCKIGYFPDGGAAFFYNKCPGEIGMFLALTGVALRARGLFHAGMLTHMVPEDRVALITPLLINDLSIPPPMSTLADIEPHVNQVFGLGSVAEIKGVLAARGGEWAKGTLEQLQKQSPTSLALTHRHLRAAKGKSLEEILKTDYRLSQHLIDGHDFREGIRAYVIDREEKPVWQPAEQRDVTEAALDALFAPLDRGMEWKPGV
jgi:enoyl-CoA hydratase/carnithine racemase